MSVKIVAGRANTGKSSYIYDEIRSYGKSKDNLILIVPELMTYQAECDLIERFDLAGIMNVEILSFNRLENKILQELGGLKVQDISVFGKIMLLKQIFEDNKDRLKIFGGSYKQSGFLREFEELIREFKQNLITSESLLKATEGIEDELLIRKLSDIELIYSEFDKKTSGIYFDEEDKRGLFISLIGESKYIKNSRIWIDGFESFNLQRLKLIKNLRDYSKSLSISLNIDSKYLENFEDKGDWEAFKIIRDTYHSLEEIFQGQIDLISVSGNKSNSWEIKALEENLFSLMPGKFNEDTDNISIYSSLNPYSESQKLATKIISLVRDKGYRWKDIKVAIGNMDTYETNIERVFTQYEIPYFLDVKKDILNNPLTKYILSILDIFIWRFKHDNVFDYLKTGFSPLTIDQVQALENYALKYGIEGNKWFREFKFSEREEEEEWRRNFVDDFEMERKEIKGLKTVNDITKFIFNYLEKHQVKEKMEESIKAFNKAQKFQEASEYSQCWNYVMEIFRQLLLVGQDTEISVKEYRKMLEAGFSEVEVSIIPPSIDKVEVGPIDRIAVTKPKALFVLGANDTNLDGKNTDKGLLLSEERDLLLEKDLSLTKSSDYETFKDRHMVYKLFSSPKNRLCISYPLSLTTGESLQPSLYIDTIKEIFIKIQFDSDLSKSEEIDYVSNYSGTYDFFVENMRKYIEGYKIDSIWKDVYAWYEKEDDNFHLIKGALTYKNSVDPLETGLVKRIYQNNMTMTVSKLERYAECQFKYFMENVLKPREREIQKIELYDLGNIYHSVVERFIDKIKEKKTLSIDRDEVEREAVLITDQVLRDHEDRLTAIEANYRNSYMKEKIKRVMRRTCWTNVRQLQQSEFRPIYTELQIDLIDKDDDQAREGIYLQPIEIPVETDKIKEVLKLRGKIDRVDVFENKGKLYISIIDYKSSYNDIDFDDVSEGLQIQLIIYLKALVDNGQELFGKKPHIGGIFYYHISDPVYMDDNKSKDPEEEIFKTLKLRGFVLRDEEIVQFMDKNIGSTSSVIPAAFKKNGDFYEGRTKALTEEAFNDLIDYVYIKCIDMTKSILNGNIKINPYKKLNGTTPCTYCDYAGICQFDKSLGNNFRLIGKVKEGFLQDHIDKEETR